MHTYMRTHIHTQPCTKSTPFTPDLQACVPCVHKHNLCMNNAHMPAHTHTHAHVYPCITLRLELASHSLSLSGSFALLFPLPGSPLPRHLPGSLPHLLTRRSPRPSPAALQWTLLCPPGPLPLVWGATKMRWRRSPGNPIPPPPHVRERATHHTPGHGADERLSCAWSPGFPATGRRVTIQLQAQRLLPLFLNLSFPCCELGG